jgi:hypothetical protein
LLSVLFAAAAAALSAIWALRLLGSRAAAALAGSLVALGSVPVEYAEQLRAYALVVLLSMAFGLLLAEAALRPAPRWLVGLAAVTALGALTHYFFLFVGGAGVAWLWAARPRPPAAGRTTLAIAAGTAVFLPWLPGFWNNRRTAATAGSGHSTRPRWPSSPASSSSGRTASSTASRGSGHRCADRRGNRALVAPRGRQRRGSARPAPDSRLRRALGRRPADLQRAQHAAGRPVSGDLGRGGVKALPARLVPVAAAMGIVVAVGGAAYAQATLGRVAYDSVAVALTDLGWSSREPLLVDYPTAAANRRGVGIQITSAASWYLPGRPLLIWAPRRRVCRARFAIVETRNPHSWLVRYGNGVSASRAFEYYDHPILGRPRGRILVARFRARTRLRGAFYYALGEQVSCQR